MNLRKWSGGIMSELPDVLGTITKGTRLTLDMADLAFGLRPTAITAGRPFDALLLVQNLCNSDIDAKIRLVIPDKDLKGTRGRFATNADKPIVIGLRAGEVGYVSLPVIANPQATPGSGYVMQINVEILRQEKNPTRTRTNAHAPLDASKLSAAIQDEIGGLQTLAWSAGVAGKPGRNTATMQASFTLQPPGISKLEQPAKPGWKVLWTMAEGLEQESLAEQARRYTSAVLPQLTRRHMFFPMLKALQHHAEESGYRLWAGEAVVITKLIIILMETGQAVVSTDVETVQYPRWFEKLCQVLLKQPDLVSQAEKLVTELIFPEIMYDTALSAFTMLKTATTEDLGTPQEMAEYAELLMKTFNGERLDFTHLYMPLVLAGVFNSSRLIMPGEQSLDTLELMVNARIQRDSERSEENDFIFHLLDEILDRALALVDKKLNLQRYLDPIERLRYKE
jgi:hypothetical protein